MSTSDGRVFVTLVLAIPLAFLLSASPTVRAQDYGDDPAAVVQAFIDAGNAGDAAAGAAMFADNATYVSSSPSSPCRQQSPCTSRADILAGLQFNDAVHLCITPLEWAGHGTAVTVYAEGRNDPLRANGIERVMVEQMYLVEQGRIIAFYNVNDRADPQTATNGAINAGAQAPGAPIPNPASPCS